MNNTIWRTIILALIFILLAALVLQCGELASAQAQPYPTQMATSWAATPTRQPMRPCPCVVHLPEVQR